MKYRSEIDGLRAMAVLPVILFHAGFSTLSGGFLGVDIFFTISGYLITSIILQDIDAGKFSIATFYVRRIRRILPALFLVLISTGIAALTLFPPPLLLAFSESLMSVSTFSSNIYFWLTGGYFGLSADLKPLLHTWSLAVEEQYYALFPLALMLFWRFGKNKLFLLIASATFLSLIASQWGAYHKPGATFFLLPTRMWQILLGSCLAFYINIHGKIPTSQHQSQYLSLLGIILIITAYIVLDENTPLPSIYALIPTIGALLVIACAHERTIANKILSHRLISGIGLISYSAYLWHQPIFVFARYKFETPSPFLMAGLTLLTLSLAAATWYFVEQPCRKTKNFSTVKVFFLAFLGLCICFSVGLTGKITNGFEGYYYNFRLTPEQKERYLLIKKQTHYPLVKSLIDNGDCHFWQETVTEENATRFEECHKKYGKAVVILGDSHAMNLYNIVVKTDIHPFIFGVLQGGCRAYEDLPHCHYKSFNQFIEKHNQQVKYILFHQSGSHVIKDRNGKYSSQSAFEKNAGYSFNMAYIDSLIDYTNKLNKNVPTFWMGPYVESRYNYDAKNSLKENDDFTFPETSIPIFEELDKTISDKAREKSSHPSRYISLVRWMGIKKRNLEIENCLIFKDQDHISTCGEDYWARQLKPRLKMLHENVYHNP